ncbi:MAG: hydrogenase maturation protease [Calditrichaeota bacterium]|nr:hydrogenase maturation protease [Calditrichota bacterium]
MSKVIVLGNRLRGDDAIGPVVLDELKKQDIPIPVTLIEAGSDAFTLLEHLNGKEPLIIVDCAQMGAVPGTVKRIGIDLENFNINEQMISLHGFSFSEVLSMARGLGAVAPCTVIGIQPESLNMGDELSAGVRAAIPRILNMIIEEAKKYAEKNLNY